MRYPHKIKIYKKQWHLAAAFLFIILPFLFVMIFSRLTGVEANKVLTDLGASLLRIAVAYIMAVTLAFCFAVFLGQGKIGEFFLPIFDVLQSFPSFALLPLLMLKFGAGNIAVILFLVAAIIWAILFSTISAIRMARKDLEEAAFIFGARGIKRFFSFTMPIALPGLITGSVVGLGEGWDAVVGAEIIANTPGIGGFLKGAAEVNNVPILAFGIMALLLLVFSINKLIWLPLLKKSHKYSHE